MSKTVGIARFNPNSPTQTVVLKTASLACKMSFGLPRWWNIAKYSDDKQWEVDLESQY